MRGSSSGGEAALRVRGGAWLADFSRCLPRSLPLQAQEQSGDATLNELALWGTVASPPVRLSPSFDSDTFTCTASVANRLGEVLLLVTPSDDDASFVVTSSNDTSPERFTADADWLSGYIWMSERTEWARLNLDVGSNTEADDTRFDGTVTTGFLGADVDTGRWLGGAALTPSLELGLRHDAGDAETGTGISSDDPNRDGDRRTDIMPAPHPAPSSAPHALQRRSGRSRFP